MDITAIIKTYCDFSGILVMDLCAARKLFNP